MLCLIAFAGLTGTLIGRVMAARSRGCETFLLLLVRHQWRYLRNRLSCQCLEDFLLISIDTAFSLDCQTLSVCRRKSLRLTRGGDKSPPSLRQADATQLLGKGAGHCEGSVSFYAFLTARVPCGEQICVARIAADRVE